MGTQDVKERVEPIIQELLRLSAGFGNPNAIHKLLRAASDEEISWLAENMGRGPACFIALENQVRLGTLVDWRCTQETVDDGEISLEIQPPKPLEYVSFEFSLPTNAE